MFELNIFENVQVKDAAHREIIKRRREQLEKHLDEMSRFPRLGRQVFRTPSKGLDNYIADLSEQLVKVATDRTGTSPGDRFSAYRPINVFIQAPPGAGKSSLVRHLSDSLRTSGQRVGKLLEVNCSNLASFAEVIPVFEQLQVLHTNGVMPVVFFDEIDVPSWEAFQFMLMPMNEGAVLSHGHRISFGSAIIFFAASKEMRMEDSTHAFRTHDGQEWIIEAKKQIEAFARTPEAPKKFPDFYSRIDFLVSLPGMRDHFLDFDDSRLYVQEETSMDMIVKMIKHRFAQIEKIDKRVILFLAGSLPESKREIEKAVFQSTANSAETRFKFDHLPNLLLEGPWYKAIQKQEESFIDIEYYHWIYLIWDLAQQIVRCHGLTFNDGGTDDIRYFFTTQVPIGLTRCRVKKGDIGDELQQTEVGLANTVKIMMLLVREAKKSNSEMISLRMLNDVLAANKDIWPYC